MKVVISPYALARMILSSQVQNETAGVAVGHENDEDDGIVVMDAIWTRVVGSAAYVSVPATVIASIAESLDMLGTGEYIVGWYHTHPGFGHFMSHTDIQTQLKLQNLYEKMVAIVVDPLKEDPLNMAKAYRVIPPREVEEIEVSIEIPEHIKEGLNVLGIKESEPASLVKFFMKVIPKTSI